MTDSDRIAALERISDMIRQGEPVIPPTPTADTWSGIIEVCRVRGTYGRSDYITTGNRMDNRCNLRVTFDGSELIKAEVARPPNTPDGMRMFAVIDMSAPTPPTPTPSQEEALAALHTLWINKEKVSEARLLLTTFILARPDTEVKLPNFGGFNDGLSP